MQKASKLTVEQPDGTVNRFENVKYEPGRDAVTVQTPDNRQHRIQSVRTVAES